MQFIVQITFIIIILLFLLIILSFILIVIIVVVVELRSGWFEYRFGLKVK